MARVFFGRRDARLWEDAEIAIVRELWPVATPVAEIAVRVGHPIGSTQTLARQLGLVWGSAVFKIQGDRPTREELRRLLDYDPATGLIRRRIGTRHTPAGEIAGSLDEKGYRRIMVGGRRYRATTLIWIMMTGEWPVGDVDHRDTYGLKADWGDRWANLRVATGQQNNQNQRLGRRNTTGHNGVRRARKRPGWEVYIHAGKPRRGSGRRREIYIGHFSDYDAAVAARRDAEVEYFGEFAPVHIDEFAGPGLPPASPPTMPVPHGLPS